MDLRLGEARDRKVLVARLLDDLFITSEFVYDEALPREDVYAFRYKDKE